MKFSQSYRNLLETPICLDCRNLPITARQYSFVNVTWRSIRPWTCPVRPGKQSRCKPGMPCPESEAIRERGFCQSR